MSISFFKWILSGGLFLQIATATASTDTQNTTLRVYGPSGPHHVRQECADLYLKRTGVDVAVIKSLPYDLKRKLREDGDIYYGGDKYMLEEFNKQNPGVLDVSTLEKLHARRVGIIVRKGNPLNINGVDALRQGDVNILDVKLGKMRSFYGDPNDELCNVSRLEYTGRQGLSVWINSPDIDA